MTSEGLQPYTTITYANGPGYADHWDMQAGTWRNVSGMDTEADNFRQMAAFPLIDETHGGEDVTVYAVGPQAHLLTGVHEQSYLPHVAAYAGCWKGKDLGCPASAAPTLASSLALILLLMMV